jgi:hypothetical protein
MDSLAYHLTVKRRKFLAHRIIGQVMRRDTVQRCSTASGTIALQALA